MMSVLNFFKRHKIVTVLLFIIVGVIAYHYIAMHVVNERVKGEMSELSSQEKSLNLQKPKEHTEKEVGCKYSEQNWDSEGCFIGVTDTYYEGGPDRKAKRQITATLLSHGWQKRQVDYVWPSSAVKISGGDISFTKQTPQGRYCAGISYGYFSNDIQNGPRSVELYMLSPADHACSRW